MHKVGNLKGLWGFPGVPKQHKQLGRHEVFLLILNQLIYKVTGSEGLLKQVRFDYL